MVFGENYYQREEIFKIEKTGQQCIVMSTPIRKADNKWAVMVRLLDDDYSSVLDMSGCQPGDTTRFIGKQLPSLKQINCWKATVIILC